MAEKEEEQTTKENAIMHLMGNFQRERFLRRRRNRQKLNSRIKRLAELKLFKRNYKNLVDKIGAISTVSK